MKKFFHYIWRTVKEMAFVFQHELQNAFHDEAVKIFVILVPLGYPLLYSYIYTNEVVREIPIAVVDNSQTSLSRKYIRKVDATENVKVKSFCSDLDEAQELMRRHEIYGIIYIPTDFSTKLNKGEQVNVYAFSDASSLLYYKGLVLANTFVSLDMNANFKIMKAGNYTDRQDELTAAPLKYEDVNIYNPQVGVASFLIPAVLMLILQQTMLLGVSVTAGTLREKNLFRLFTPLTSHPGGTIEVVLGRTMFYLLLYYILSIYVLGITPRIFHLNHIGHFIDIATFMLPYLLSITFFAMSFSYVVKTRESCMMLILYMSMIFIFISGISWPASDFPKFWKYFSYLIPSTLGINGFTRINNMGARLDQVAFEYEGLWIQTACYFLIACLVARRDIRQSVRSFNATHEIHVLKKK